MKFSSAAKYCIAALVLGAHEAAWAEPLPSDQPIKPVVATGVVPNEATKARLIARLRSLYGNRVVDQIAIGNVIAPPDWATNVEKIFNENLKQISQGQINVSGMTVSLRGQVGNEGLRQQLVSHIATHLTSSYNVKDALTVMTSAQTDINDMLAGRIIEFDSGSANIRVSSQGLLDAIAQRIASLDNKHVEVIGHTDNQGNSNNNLILSRARAEAVKAYLVQKGIAAERIATNGLGDAQPVADNETPEGRTRNRRIEFRIVNL